MSETKFQVGDVCIYQGCEGVIISINLNEKPYPITAVFNGSDEQFSTFTLDGRYNVWHKEPSLKLIERPKKKVTKTMYQAAYRRESGIVTMSLRVFKDEKEAKNVYGDNFIALGPAITFEVEE